MYSPASGLVVISILSAANLLYPAQSKKYPHAHTRPWIHISPTHPLPGPTRRQMIVNDIPLPPPIHTIVPGSTNISSNLHTIVPGSPNISSINISSNLHTIVPGSANQYLLQFTLNRTGFTQSISPLIYTQSYRVHSI